MSIGLIGRKAGMTQVFQPDGTMVAVSVVAVAPNTVTRLRTADRDGYTAVQLGTDEKDRLNKPRAGQLGDLPSLGTLREFRVDDVDGYEVGQTLAVGDLFADGDLVDVSGISKGKGFSGVMKRHNFSGQGASHGNHKKHRAPGAIGACATPARVFKGTKMAGRMGGERVTTQNLQVVRADAEAGVVLVRGSVPGPDGGVVLIRNAAKVTVKGGNR